MFEEKMTIRLFLMGAGLIALGACTPSPAGDAPAQVAPPVETPVAVAPPPVEPLVGDVALASVDPAILCQIFERAMSDDAGTVKGAGCVPTPSASGLTIATANGSQTLEVPLVVSGSVIQLTPANASPKAVPAAAGGFSNIGMLFFGRADASALCMSVEYMAVDGAANSLFFGRGPDKKPVKFDLPVSGDAFKTEAFPEQTVAAGKVRVFTLTRREPGTIVKTVSFKSC